MQIEDASIVTGYVPGLVGRVTEMHARYYAREWEFSAFFETRVATEMSAFINRYDAARDCTWSVLCNERIEASITIDAIDAEREGAHLRWFIVSARMRGQGLGARLIQLALDFCRERCYRRVYLETISGLEAARHLYQRAGFRLVDSRIGEQWGRRIEEQRYLAEF